MKHQTELDYLTEGYTSVAQMNINLAYDLGYITHPEYMLIAPYGDDSSAGLPFVIEPIPHANSRFEFLSYDAQVYHIVEPDFQVLVYVKSTFCNDVGNDLILLKEFAAQFAPDTIIGQFLNPSMLAWLERNNDMPDIYHEYVRMKNAAYRLEDNILDMERLFDKDPLPY